MPSPEWKQYQEDTAGFFQSLGLEAATDVTMKGARTKHDVDVLVRSEHLGFEVTWIVECKLWSAPISKLHVLGLRTIVSDLGADRGILLSESGFQSGALEAANLTNIQLSSLKGLESSAKNDIFAMRMRELHDRLDNCHSAYWDISKENRIRFGLRPEVGSIGYSGSHILEFCSDILARAFRGNYPFTADNGLWFEPPREFISPENVITQVEQMVEELESKLAAVSRTS
ncbi:restriction endonuclease [Sneathiella glossodoripedis]|uniref:restriction endonuclease n=1 Tax=Sneathiella glossodoripedis TaxID=418853 RepID=UPI0004709E9C|nr:restriction endonuclease [Sneathiella glossodoripedis]